MHIDKAYKIIENNLPSNYVKLVQEKLEDPDLSSGIIRNLKNRVTKYPKTKINVLNALVEVANEYQEHLRKLRDLTQ
ncbi:MAG: hypothetical protein LDL23_09945 [Flavobacterium sp.]|uniref:hypothetical protein n=1 Tax=Flavobacterium sp. TaxID=239 RepID=UPI0025BDB51B|nr:hypothetical protein [Flavobacterium sp.]MCA1966958.1 hypothetical protein [Flavobacterium sp.]